MLVVLGIWRHWFQRVPLSYDPLYWGLVFPLGMYTTCSFRLAQVLELSVLTRIAGLFGIVAIVAWLLTFLGMANRILQALRIGFRRKGA